MPEATNLITVKFKPTGHNELKKAINSLAKAQSKLEGGTAKYNKSGAFTTKTNRLQSNSFATLRSKILLFNFAVGVLGVKALTNFAKQAAKVDSMSRAFKSLSGGALNASSAVDKLKKATNGTMSEFNLFQQANNAMILGVSKNSDEMAEMFDIAQRLGKALGRDTASSVESLITGIGRQSRLMLDNIGIIVKSEEAYEAHAKKLRKNVDELTDAERKQAFLNATMESARRKLKGLGVETETSEDTFQRFQAAMEDFAVAVGEVVLPAMVTVLDTATGIANIWNEFLGSITDEPDIDPFMAFREGMPKTKEGIKDMIASLEAQKEELLSVGESVETVSNNMSNGFDPAMDGMITSFQLLKKEEGDLIITHGEMTSATNDMMRVIKDGNIGEILVDPIAIANEETADFAETIGSVDSRILDIVAKIILLNAELEKLNENGDKTNKVWGEEALKSMDLIVGRFSAMTSAMSTQIETRMQNEIDAMKGTEKYQNVSAERRETMEHNITKKYAKERERVAMFEKTSNFAQAGINIATAITKAFTYDPSGILASFVAAMGVTQLAAIMSTPLPKFAQGGYIGGRRHSQGGTMIEAEQGEFVMSRNAVESVGIEAMNRINQGGGAGITVNVSGNVMTQDFVEGDLAEAIRQAARRGTDFGVS